MGTKCFQMDSEDLECENRDGLDVNRKATVSMLAGSLEGEQGGVGERDEDAVDMEAEDWSRPSLQGHDESQPLQRHVVNLLL